MSEIVLTLVQNIAILVSLSVIHSLVMHRLELSRVARRTISGLVFGTAGVIAMMTPMVLAEGIIFDGRSVIVGVAGLTGGPLTGAVAATLCAAYRLHLGGAGAAVGVAVVLEAAALGVAFRYLVRRTKTRRIGLLWVFGISVHVIMLLLLLLLPDGTGPDILRQIAAPVLIIFTPATVVLSLYILDDEANTQALRDSETRFERTLSKIPDVVAVYDTHLRIRYINAATRRVSGKNEAYFIGRRDDEIWPPHVYESYLPTLRTALETGQPREVDAFVEIPDVGHRAMHITYIPITDKHDQVAEIIAVTHDFTERDALVGELRRHKENLEEVVKTRTQELERTNEELQEATAAKDRFLASMSHELRTPLNSIIGFSGLQLQGLAGPLNDEQSRQTRMIKNSGERLLALINQILDVAKLDAGGAKVELAEIDVESFLDTVGEELQPQIESTRHTLVSRAASNSPVRLITDESKLRQILQNLLSNASKYSNPGLIELSVQPADDALEFAVQDSGPGIPVADHERVFLEFERLNPSEQPGTGLGLKISRDLATVLGGTLELDSSYEPGARFVLRLPLEGPPPTV